jgi:hypothetical protein
MGADGDLWRGGSDNSGTQYVYNSGTWGISITGNANTATSAGNADTVDGYHESSFWRDRQDREIGILRFSGVGGNSGNSNQSYAIYQEGGAWSPPFPDLCIGYHTGIKIGAYFGYNGIRFYNNSDFATQTFSVNDGDDNVRVAYNLHIGSAGGWITDLLADKQNASTAITTSNIGSQSVSYASSAGSLTSMNISQFTNNSGYITSSASISGNAASATFARRIAGPERIGFDVGGDASTFYPIAISTGAGSTESQYSEFVIERGGYDDPGYTGIGFSTFNARFTYKPSGWGYNAVYFNLEQLTQTATMLGDYLDQYQSSQAIIWLRGATRYNIYSVYGGIGLIFTNESGTSYTMAYGTYDPISTPREKATTAKYYDSTVRYAGTIYTGSNAVIHAGNIGSQSVASATTAGSLTSMNISQFTNNSGYLTSATVGNMTRLWAESHPTDYYVRANWTGSYWQLTSNHPSPVQVGYADNAGSATTAGALTSMNISQFTNNSGYITSVPNLQYGGGDSLTGAGTATTWDPRGTTYDRYVIGNHTGISLHGYPGYGGVRLYAAGYPTLTTSVLRLEASDAVYTFGGLYSNGNAVIHEGNIGSQSVNYALNSTRLYASDDPYTYGGDAPYYMYMTYDGSRWLLKVTPGTPADVRVSYADSAGSAGSATSASTVTHYASRTDGTWYNAIWGAGNPSHLYSCDAVQIQSSTGAVKANIFYDSQDTTYYVDPAGNGTRAAFLNGNVWISPKSESYGEGISFLMPSQATWGGLRWVRGVSNFTGAWAFGYFGNESNDNIGFHSGGVNGWRLDHSWNMTAIGSVRAPIFYDSEDTGYYLDPNGTSNLRKFSAFTMAYNGMNPMSANSDYVGRYNGSVGYRNGTMGIGNTDFNTIFSNWGSGFIDTWSSPANAPGGSSHYIGLQSMHYSELNTNTVYGFQMACAGEADNRFFWRSSWPSKRNWVEMIHSGTIGSQSVSYAATAGDAGSVDGVDSSRIVFGDNERRTTRLGDMNTYNQSSGFFYENNPANGPFADWTNWMNVMGALWENNYGFQLAHQFHDNGFAVRRVTAGTFYSWRRILDSENFTSWAQEKENQRLSTSSSVTFTNIYNNAWFRNNNVNEGLYNQATGTHFYSNSVEGFVVTGSGGVVQLQFRSNHQSTLRGYVYADTSNNIGFLNNGGNWSLRCDSSGNVTATGDVTAYSDARLKTNVNTIEGALEKVLQMRGVTYVRTDNNDTAEKVGVIAQEIQQVLPQVVNENTDGYLTVSYGNIVGVLIEAIKEQQAQIDELKAKLDGLTK